MKNRIINENMLNDYKKSLIADEKSSATIEKYIRDILKFYKFIGRNYMTKEIVVDYKNMLINDGYSIRSINSMLASLNSFFRFLNWNEYCVKALKVQNEVFIAEEKELTRAEYIRLVMVLLVQK